MLRLPFRLPSNCCAATSIELFIARQTVRVSFSVTPTTYQETNTISVNFVYITYVSSRSAVLGARASIWPMMMMAGS